MSAKSELRVRLFGGFEVWCDDEQLTGFESQKVRALLAYLMCQRQRTFTRDRLAALLWAEKGPGAARHALRQALYNAKTVLAAGGVKGLIRSSPTGIGIDPRARVWLDVEAFEDALRLGRSRGSADPHQLAIAARLYRGELLAGFFVKDCITFGDWLIGEQERLRESAVEVLETLVDLYRRRGEYRFAIHYARRLVTLEPLSEAAYRELIRVYGLAGRRSRALIEYDKLQAMLQQELGVAPLAETRALHESIQLDELEEVAPAEEIDAIGPLIPLAGRADLLEALGRRWDEARAGGNPLILVAGEDGAGKTRLLKSWLDSLGTRLPVTVLKGRCFALGQPVPYQPFRQIVGNAVNEEAERSERVLDALPEAVLADLALLFPDLLELRPELSSSGARAAGTRARLFSSVARFLAELQSDSPEGDSLVLFLDDLHLADGDSLDLLEHLLVSLRRSALRIVAAYDPAALGADHPRRRPGTLLAAADELRVDRLPAAAVREVAEALVGPEQGPLLANLLGAHAAGLPLALTELINLLWDDGVLVPQENGDWRLREGDPGALQPFRSGDLNGAILHRIRRLPSSTRRLAALGAVAGQSFDPALLEGSEQEHSKVVEVALEVMLKRWLIRQFAPYWSSDRRERDLVRWERGTRRGSFEFAHARIRTAIYEDIQPARRQALHGQLAVALEAQYGHHPERICETLAHHFLAAGMWRQAVGYLRMAAAKTRALCAGEAADHYDRLTREVTDRLQRATATGRSAKPARAGAPRPATPRGRGARRHAATES